MLELAGPSGCADVTSPDSLLRFFSSNNTGFSSVKTAFFASSLLIGLTGTAQAQFTSQTGAKGVKQNATPAFSTTNPSGGSFFRSA